MVRARLDGPGSGSIGVVVAMLMVGAWALGCSEEQAAPASATAEPSTPSHAQVAEEAVEQRSPEELAAAGRGVYNANCIACHSMNPAQDGALGPAVAGASLELLEARLVHGTYPEGYTPKRDSRVMVPLPHLERQLPELAAYLATD